MSLAVRTPHGTTRRPILPGACRPSIKVCVLLVSSRGRTKEATGLLCRRSTGLATSVKVAAMGGKEAMITC